MPRRGVYLATRLCNCQTFRSVRRILNLFVNLTSCQQREAFHPLSFANIAAKQKITGRLASPNSNLLLLIPVALFQPFQAMISGLRMETHGLVRQGCAHSIHVLSFGRGYFPRGKTCLVPTVGLMLSFQGSDWEPKSLEIFDGTSLSGNEEPFVYVVQFPSRSMDCSSYVAWRSEGVVGYHTLPTTCTTGSYVLQKDHKLYYKQIVFA